MNAYHNEPLAAPMACGGKCYDALRHYPGIRPAGNRPIRTGRLIIKSSAGPPPAAFRAAIKAHKDAILQALTASPGVAAMLAGVLARCQPLTPNVLTPEERAKQTHSPVS